MTTGARIAAFPPVKQADAVLSQASPVSTTLYGVGIFATAQRNVRIISIMASVTWTVTQPTPLEVVVTIDGQSIVHTQANPVTGVSTAYLVIISPHRADNAQRMIVTTDTVRESPFIHEGRSVKIEVRATTTTGATSLDCRVKWAKW